jgi:cytochrome c biogenesis protein CcmG, thiol:disulfide interchange protein DsbE
MRMESATRLVAGGSCVHRRGRLRALLPLAGAVLVGLGLALVLLGRFAQATQRVALLPPAGAKAAPDFRMVPWNTAGASAIRLAALRSRVVVVNFWAPWCEPCQTEAPVLRAAAAHFAPAGVVFVGVAFQTTQRDVLAFIGHYGIAYPVGPAPDGIDVAYGVTGLPYTFVIAPDGDLIYTFAGPVQPEPLDRAIQAAQRQPASSA